MKKNKVYSQLAQAKSCLHEYKGITQGGVTGLL